MMGTAKHIGRIGARMTVTIGAAAVLVMPTAVPAPPLPVSPAVKLSTDSTALIMGTSGIPTPDDFYVESVKNQFIAPTHPDQDIEYVKVATPEELWPSALPGRLLSLLGLGLGDPRLFGPGGPGWDVPWWKLLGLFDLTLNQSVLAGLTDLEAAMAKHGNDDLVIYGYSQSALIANREKQRLAEQYPKGTEAPNIDFVLGGDENLPNGGLFARFPGFYIPILDWSLNGPAPTDTQFDTVEINRQYDFMGDFPLYPLNFLADLNALLGFPYVHLYPFDVSLPADPTTSPAYQGTHGDTSYYFFETQNLPLFAPLRALGVPEPLIDVVEPFFRVLVDLGYDRSIPPWEPTPARLIPTLNPAKVITDLVNAIGQGINNALALIGLPPLLSIPAPVTVAAPATQTATADMSPHVTSSSTPTQDQQATSTGVVIGTRQISTDTVTSTTTVAATSKTDGSPPVTAIEAVTETTKATSTAAGASELPTTATPEASAISTQTPEPTKPADQPVKPRPVVRGPLEVAGAQFPDRSHRRAGDPPTTRSAAAGAQAATGALSSTASSPAASSTGSSPGGEGDGS